MKYAINGLTRFADNPSDFKVMNYNPNEKKMILDYMKSFEMVGTCGYIDDCKTGKVIKITNSFYDDGEYTWSKQDIYHIEKYNAAVETDFIDSIKKKTA